MPLTGSDVLSSSDLGAGIHAFPVRRITVPTGTRGLFLRVEENASIPPGWFRPGTVTWQAILPGNVPFGLETVQLFFDDEVSYFPPQFLWGGDFRAILRLRDFMPLVRVVYGRYTDL